MRTSAAFLSPFRIPHCVIAFSGTCGANSAVRPEKQPISREEGVKQTDTKNEAAAQLMKLSFSPRLLLLFSLLVCAMDGDGGIGGGHAEEGTTEEDDLSLRTPPVDVSFLSTSSRASSSSTSTSTLPRLWLVKCPLEVAQRLRAAPQNGQALGRVEVTSSRTAPATSSSSSSSSALEHQVRIVLPSIVEGAAPGAETTLTLECDPRIAHPPTFLLAHDKWTGALQSVRGLFS